MRQQTRTPTAAPPAETPEEGLNEDEQREIERRIDELFTDRRIVPEQDLSSEKELSSGALFPIAVNLLVLAALAAGLWFLVLPNWSTEEMARTAEADYETTEAFVVGRVREQAEQEISAQEQRIAEVRRQLETLREQRFSAPGTNEQAGAREAELQEELNRLIAELEQQRSRVGLQQGGVASPYEVRLDELQQRQEELRFVLDQLGFAYQTMDRHLSAGNSPAAIEELDRADQFLANLSIAEDGAFANTLSVLEQGNGALREALQLFDQTSGVDPREAEQLARLDMASELVGDADALMSSGNEQEAERLYRNALVALDPTERAFQQVESLEADRLAAERAELAELRERVAFLESEIEARNRSIASLQSDVRGALAAVRTALTREIGDGSSSDPERLADLLETKTLIREVLSSDVVQREYPELYLEMERYLDALGERRVAEGRTQGIYGAVVALRELMEGIDIAPATEVDSSSGTDQLRTALAEDLLVLVQGVLAQAR